MSDIQAELRHVLAELKRSAPGLTHIHAQIEKILLESVGFDHGGYIPPGLTTVTNMSGTAEPIIGGGGGGGAAIAYNPEFEAGVKMPTNAKRVLEVENGEPAPEEDLDNDEYDDEDESGDANDAA